MADDSIVRGRRVLVIRPGALGDAVLTLPALNALRLAGAREIVILGNPASWRFLRSDLPGVRMRDYGSADWLGLFAQDVSLGGNAAELLTDMDVALVYLHSGRDTCERALVRAGLKTVLLIDPPRLWTRVEDLAQPAVTSVSTAQTISEHSQGCHASRLLIDPLACWLGEEALTSVLAQGRIGHAQEPLLMVSEDERRGALSDLGLIDIPDRGFLGIHAGSGGRGKCWPAERFAALAKRLHGRTGLRPLLFVGPADEETQAALNAVWPRDLPVVRALHRPLRSVLALLTLVRVYVGNDSGVSHLAARCCPTVALFGPTDPRVWCPLGGKVRVIQGEANTLKRLSVERVEQAVVALAPGEFR